MRWMKPMVATCAAAAFVVGGLAITGRAQMDEPAAATTKPASDDAPVAPPSKTMPPKAKPAKAIRLVQPWSKVADLTDEQKQQIFDIHEDFKAKMKALEAEEEEKCNAVLTEAQRTQMAETLDADKATQKTKAAERRAADKKPAE